ncbi:MAG: hypothetical protein AAFN78_19940, partial [Pseudomonadota bacterium]
MKYASALAIAGIAISLLIIGFPLLQSKAAQLDLKRQDETERTARNSADSTPESVELGLSRQLSTGSADAPQRAPANPRSVTSGWGNPWLLPLAALPMLAGLIVGWLVSAYRRGRARGSQVEADTAAARQLANRLAYTQEALAERDETIEELQAQLDKRQKAADGTDVPDMAALEAQIAERDEIIKGLEETVNENHERWMNLEISESDRQERVLRLESELRTASTIIHSLEDDVAEWKARADSTLPDPETDIE